MRRQIILSDDGVTLGRRLAPGVVSVISRSTPATPAALPQVLSASLDNIKRATSTVVSKLPTSAPINVSLPVDPRISAQMSRISPTMTLTQVAEAIAPIIPFNFDKIRSVLSAVKLPALAGMSILALAGLVYLALRKKKPATEPATEPENVINKAMEMITRGKQLTNDQKVSLRTRLLALAETNSQEDFLKKAVLL